MGITEITIPNIHTPVQVNTADLMVRRLNLNGKTIAINLSMVMIVRISTDTSLESIDKIPIVRQPQPDLHSWSCLKYSPCHLASIMAIANRYTPMNMSANARFVSRNDWTLFSSLSIIRHIMTARLPKKARIPSIQIQI